MRDGASVTLKQIEEDWTRAILANDLDAIDSVITEDWALIGADGKVIERTTFLGVIRSGDLTHEIMELDDWDVRVHKDAGVVITRATTRGQYKGQSFATVERSTSFYVRDQGRWHCVLTQLSPLH